MNGTCAVCGVLVTTANVAIDGPRIVHRGCQASRRRRPTLEEAIEVVREAGYPIPDPWPDEDDT